MLRTLLTMALAALVGLSLASPAEAAERRKVIIDQDAFEGPGLQPILMVLQDPSVEVIGITTVSGDGWQAEETSIVLRMLELIGRTDVPVAAGATFPLINSKARNSRREAQYGALGYRGAWTDVWPGDNTMVRRQPHGPFVIPLKTEGAPRIAPVKESAAEFMLGKTRAYPGQVTILAMGPLTNLALAQRLDDGFAARVKEVVTEGGLLLGMNPSAGKDEFGAQISLTPRMSFNHFWDPEASHIVFTSPWPKLTLVTNDASLAVIGTKDLLDRATASGTRTARYVKAIAAPGYPLWDEVEAAAWLRPDIVTRRDTLFMDVDLLPGANYGALLTWPRGREPGLGEREVDVIYSVDERRTQDMFVGLLGR